MDECDPTDLESEATWDLNAAVVHPASSSARAIVSVPFEHDEFERLAANARQNGKTITEYVRSLVVQQTTQGKAVTERDETDVMDSL